MSAGQAAAGRRAWPTRTKRRRRRAGPSAAARLVSVPGRVVALLPPRLRRRLLIALGIVLVLAAGYRLWLRDSAFVSVEKVTVTGLTTKDAARVRAALTSAAHGMTTLHVRMDDLEQAIAAYPVVRTLDVGTDFPHGLTIHVVEHRPAALAGGVAVAGDGTILRGLPVDGSLPRIATRSIPHGDRLTQPMALHAARIAGGAPAALRPRLELIQLRGQDGLVIQMREGPELIFGDARHVRAKWIAATRVLADPDAEGASYIDVRLPGRPAAGGLPAETVTPVAPAGTAELAPQATAAPPAETTADPATEQLPPAAPTDSPATAPESGSATAPQSTEPAPAPTDPTGAGGASPPAG